MSSYSLNFTAFNFSMYTNVHVFDDGRYDGYASATHLTPIKISSILYNMILLNGCFIFKSVYLNIKPKYTHGL